jgi:hypothetical protein
MDAVSRAAATENAGMSSRRREGHKGFRRVRIELPALGYREIH